MHEGFNDPLKAACYVGMGLAPNTMYSIAFCFGERVRSQVCASKEVVRTLEVFCRKFPRTTVLFYPEPIRGLVAELHCHCDEGSRKNCCDHGEDRPRVYVRLAEALDETHSETPAPPSGARLAV